MNRQELKSNLILLLTAWIWGFGFVAQKSAADQIGPFTFNGIRFLLGSLTILPFFMFYSARRSKAAVGSGSDVSDKKNTLSTKCPVRTNPVFAGIVAGTVMCIAVSFQQIGIIDTEAGKAAFITGLYIVFVPVFGLFIGQKTRGNTWVGALMAVVGLYLLSVTGGDLATVSRGDLLEICGAFFWAIHILVIDRFVKWVDPVKLSLFQFVTCAAISLAVALVFEKIEPAMLLQAAVPILYGGVFSVGIAYTLQVIGQKHARPSHAAIVLSMESVFAAIGGLIILSENLGPRGYIGCFLMLAGMIVSQLNISRPGIKSLRYCDTSAPVSRD